MKSKADNFSIFNNAEYASFPISFWKKIILWFLPEKKAIDGDFVCRFKTLNGVMYVHSCKDEGKL